MRLDTFYPCERRSGEPFPGGRSKVLWVHVLERRAIAISLRDRDILSHPFEFLLESTGAPDSYEGGPSAFIEARPH
jgi:hypothetical protein